jgi:hypothetical protein
MRVGYAISRMMAQQAPVGRAPDLRAAARGAGVIWLGLFTLGIGFGVVQHPHRQHRLHHAHKHAAGLNKAP